MIEASKLKWQLDMRYQPRGGYTLTILSATLIRGLEEFKPSVHG